MGFSHDKAELFFVQYMPFLLISFFFPKGYKFLWRDWEEISLFPLYDTKQIILWSRIRTMPYTKITLMWIHLFDIPMTFIMCIKDETNDIISQSSSFFSHIQMHQHNIAITSRFISFCIQKCIIKSTNGVSL